MPNNDTSFALAVAALNGGGGGGGTTNYNELENKPKINNVELTGNKSLSDLGIEQPDVDKAYVDAQLALKADESELAGKQDVLTAGDNITIENNVISATVPEVEYTAGTGIKIVDDEISTVYQDVTIPALEFSQEGEIHNDDFSINTELPEGHQGYLDFDTAYPEGGDPLFSPEIAKSFVDKWKKVGDDYKNAVIHLKCTFSNGVTLEDDLTAYDGGSEWRSEENNENMNFVDLSGTWPLFCVSYASSKSMLRCYITYRQLDESVFNNADIYLTSVEVTDNYEVHQTSDTILSQYIPVTGDITNDDGVKTIYGGAPHSAKVVGTYSGQVFNSGRMTIQGTQIPEKIIEKIMLPGYYNSNAVFDAKVHFEGVEEDLVINSDTINSHRWSRYTNNNQFGSFSYTAYGNDDLIFDISANRQYEELVLRVESFCRTHSIEDGTNFTLTVRDFDWNTPINVGFMPISDVFKINGGLVDLNITSDNGLAVGKTADGFHISNNLDRGTIRTNNQNALSTVIGGGQSGVFFNNDTLTYVGEYTGEGHPQYEYDIEASEEELTNIFNPNNWHVRYDGEEFNMFFLDFQIRGQMSSSAGLNYTHTDTANGYIDNFKHYWIELTHTVEDGESTYSAKFYYDSQEDNLEIFGKCNLDSSKYISYPVPVGAQYIPIDNTTITINSDGKLEAQGGGSSYTAGDGIDISSNVISADSTIARVDDIPTVPTNVSAFTNDAGYQTANDVATAISGKADSADLSNVAFSGDYDDLSNKPTIPTVPTVVSAFTNDAGYLTSHQDISNLATKAELEAVEDEIPDITGLATETYVDTQVATKSAVSGTNDGTNWTSLTVDGVTKDIPAGGSGGAVDSVNGQTGTVVLDADDVGALPTTGGTMTGDIDIGSNKIKFGASTRYIYCPDNSDIIMDSGSGNIVLGSGNHEVHISSTRLYTNKVVEAKNIPAQPSSDGVYTLQCSIVNGVATYTWVQQQTASGNSF